MKNLMRNEQELQNYAPSVMRVVLFGKSTDLLFSNTRLSAEDFRRLYTEAIEDLKAGYTINGCSEKNTVEYWEKQFKLLEEVEEKIENEKH